MIKTIGKHLLYLVAGTALLTAAIIVALAIVATVGWILSTIKSMFGLFDEVESLYIIFGVVIIFVFIYSAGRSVLEPWLENKAGKTEARFTK